MRGGNAVGLAPKRLGWGRIGGCEGGWNHRGQSIRTGVSAEQLHAVRLQLRLCDDDGRWC